MPKTLLPSSAPSRTRPSFSRLSGARSFAFNSSIFRLLMCYREKYRVLALPPALSAQPLSRPWAQTLVLCLAFALGCAESPDAQTSANPPPDTLTPESEALGSALEPPTDVSSPLERDSVSLPSVTMDPKDDRNPPKNRKEASKLVAKEPQTPGKRKNRLATETSPYLLQHAENPVDWHPWGEEALAKAARDGKPIFLSIGYSSCHWCHVMEAESFTDGEIAEFLNDNFVCIKVDREERPDVDAIYMMSVNIMTGRGGWPLSVFLTPDGKPFFGGTYFPARDGDRGQTIGFLTVAKRVKETWDSNKESVEKSAVQLTHLIREELEGAAPPAQTPMPTFQTLQKLQSELAKGFDPVYGGFGAQDADQPKFPTTPNLAFLVDRVQRTSDDDALKMLMTTLDRMAMGGIRDHVGGGFHRYSVDRFWHIPHFEKMLYDNGQLASVYSAAYAITKKEAYKNVLVEMMDFLEREMTSESGGFFAALDADSEHVEGKFYRWERGEWDRVLGEHDAATFAAAYAEQGKPNFEDEFYVPELLSSLDALATKPEFASGVNSTLAPLRAKLLLQRQTRVRPMTDTKVLTSWNGMMIRGLADAGRVLERNDYVTRGVEAATFLLENVRDADGRLHRTFSAGEARLNAYVDDYANLIDGLIGLHQATGDANWLNQADQLMQKQIELFADTEQGAFFYTSSDHETLIARGKQFTDNARPSGNSTSVSNLLYLAKHLDRPEYTRLATATIRAAMPIMNRHPIAVPRMGVSIAEWLDQAD